MNKSCFEQNFLLDKLENLKNKTCQGYSRNNTRNTTHRTLCQFLTYATFIRNASRNFHLPNSCWVKQTVRWDFFALYDVKKEVCEGICCISTIIVKV